MKIIRKLSLAFWCLCCVVVGGTAVWADDCTDWGDCAKAPRNIDAATGLAAVLAGIAVARSIKKKRKYAYRWCVLRILEAGGEPTSQRKPLANTPFIITRISVSVPGILDEDEVNSLMNEDADTSTIDLTTGQRMMTDVNGVLRFKVYDEVCTMLLKNKDQEITLNVGELPDIYAGDEGIKHRLLNLGYGKGSIGEWDRDTFISALRKFQRDEGLPETGVVDPTTRKMIGIKYSIL